MADVVEDEIENTLNLVVSTAEQSSNMRKALKEKILETVSTLRLLFVRIKISGDRKVSEINNLTKQVSKLETELQSCREKHSKVQQTPPLADSA
jgi:predicted  nucleic acid-binding Zn-ribbon protein